MSAFAPFNYADRVAYQSLLAVHAYANATIAKVLHCGLEVRAFKFHVH